MLFIHWHPVRDTIPTVQKAKVVLLSIAAAVCYGVIHDQITARLCVEYFTVAHPPLFHTQSPALLGLAWGVTATLGVGVVLGVLLALVSQSEGQPPIPVSELRKSVLRLLAIMAAGAITAGLIGFELSRRAVVEIPCAWFDLVPVERHDRFMAVWFAHGASYLAGLIGGGVLIFWIWKQRGRPNVLGVFPRTLPGMIRFALVLTALGVILWLRFR